MDKLILIDGNSLINRAFYALPPLNNPKGEPVNAVYGFCNMLIKAITDYNPKYIAVAFDLHAPTFRHKMYSEYKAGRRKMPDELRSQIPILKDLLRLMNIKILELESYEADDIIGTMAKRNSVMTYVLTGDRDSLQLIDATTHVFLTKRGLSEIVALDEFGLKEMYRLTPSQVIDYKALAGDSSDNIPGVAGIGDKTATSMLEKYGDLDTIYENVDMLPPKTAQKLIENKDMAYLSKTLATIDCNVPIECSLEECVFDFPFKTNVKRYFIDMAFKSLFKRDDIFEAGDSVDLVLSKREYTVVEIKTLAELNSVVSNIHEKCSFFISDSGIVSFSYDGTTEYVVTGEYSLFDPGITFLQVLDSFREVLADSSVIKIVYDGKAMMRRLAANGADICGYHDIKLMQFLSDQITFRESISEYLELIGLDKGKPACELYNLYEPLREELNDAGMLDLYTNVELPLERVLYEMESIGVGVDFAALEAVGEKLTGLEKDYSEKIYELAGVRFNVNSPKQLATVLFETLAIPYPRKDKKHSTNAEILELIKDEYEIADYVLKYRTVAKLNATYVEGLKKLIDETGKVHTDYKQTMTATGRLSSAEPNLQNIPVREQEGRELRSVFVAGEGKRFISADYSQIELRLMAHLSQDPVMIDIYNKGGDIHTMTASLIFGVPESGVTDEMRRNAKTINFGIIYGMSEYGLSNNLGCSVGEAKRFIASYFEHFGNIKKYFDAVIGDAKKSGYVTTLFGRRRKLPELSSSNFSVRAFGERAAMNTPLQGTAADIIKMAMLSVSARLKNMQSKLILQIHDELIVEAVESEAEEVKRILVECMENAAKLSIPLTVSVSEGKSWFDC